MIPSSMSAKMSFRCAGVLTFLLCFGTVGSAPHSQQGKLLPLQATVLDTVNQPPKLLDTTELPKPRVRAGAAIVYNPATHEILWESNGFQRRPIASITKVMTALVFLEQEHDLRSDVVISRRDVRRASTTYLRRGERISLYNLLHLALVASDNAAARVLARASLWGTDGFVKEMNAKAKQMGLRGTVFTDPSGLHSGNVSTAYDLSRLISYATTRPIISTIMRKPSHRMKTSRRQLTVRNTNKLLKGRLLVHGGKTGYIDASGYCLAAVVKLPDNDPLSLVVLGAGSNSRRFSEVRRLADWVSKNVDALAAPGIRPTV